MYSYDYNALKCITNTTIQSFTSMRKDKRKRERTAGQSERTFESIHFKVASHVIEQGIHIWYVCKLTAIVAHRYSPVAYVLQVLGYIIHHRFGKVSEFGCLHIDLRKQFKFSYKFEQ